MRPWGGDCSLSGHITLVVIHFIRRENENEITISFILVEMRKSKSKSRRILKEKMDKRNMIGLLFEAIRDIYTKTHRGVD